jgi:hypothetical protein
LNSRPTRDLSEQLREFVVSPFPILNRSDNFQIVVGQILKQVHLWICLNHSVSEVCHHLRRGEVARFIESRCKPSNMHASNHFTLPVALAKVRENVESSGDRSSQ